MKYLLTWMLCVVGASPATPQQPKTGRIALTLFIPAGGDKAQLRPSVSDSYPLIVELKNDSQELLRLHVPASVRERADLPLILKSLEKAESKSDDCTLFLLYELPKTREKDIMYHSGPTRASTVLVHPGESYFLKINVPVTFLAAGECKFEAVLMDGKERISGSDIVTVNFVAVP